LKHPHVQKRIEYFKSYTDENEDQSLLQTIRIPKNLLFLSDKLPQANYENKVNKKNHSFTKKNQNDLPDINVRGPVASKVKIVKKEKEKEKDVESINKENRELRDRERERERENQNSNNLAASNNLNLQEKETGSIKESGQIIHSVKKSKDGGATGLNLNDEDKENPARGLREKSQAAKKEHARNNSGNRKDILGMDENYNGLQVNRKNLSPVVYKNNQNIIPPIINSNYELPQVRNVRKKENA
jgi:hypothetical protein